MEVMVNENLVNLTDVSNGMLCFEDWCTDMLEWNTVFFFQGKISEEVWRLTKCLLEGRRCSSPITVI